MLKYAVILLDNTSVAFCHAENPYRDVKLMPLGTLKEAIVWCMKQNLNIQFVYPDYELPPEYPAVIESVDHVDIKRGREADVTVFNGLAECEVEKIQSPSIVVRLTRHELFDNAERLKSLLPYEGHVSIVITDVEKFTPDDVVRYRRFLKDISSRAVSLIKDGRLPQISILTDRMILPAMNNCNAGFESITVAPNGKFYVCPAFFYENEDDSIGSLKDGLKIKNSQLYRLDHAPICRECDAFHCRRCVWLNRRVTLEVNTPGHEQCVASHVERNASRDLLCEIRRHGEFMPETKMDEIDYLDPFEKIYNK